jgi:hypothetical protein
MDSLNALNEKIAELKAKVVSQNHNRKLEKEDQDPSDSDNLSNFSQVEN